MVPRRKLNLLRWDFLFMALLKTSHNLKLSEMVFFWQTYYKWTILWNKTAWLKTIAHLSVIQEKWRLLMAEGILLVWKSCIKTAALSTKLIKTYDFRLWIFWNSAMIFSWDGLDIDRRDCGGFRGQSRGKEVHPVPPVSPGPGPVLAPWMGLSSCPPSLDIDQFSVTSLDTSQHHQESHTRVYQQLN